MPVSVLREADVHPLTVEWLAGYTSGPHGCRSTMTFRFATKDGTRESTWNRLARAGVAREPLPPHGRIPNFAGARTAAVRLFEVEPWRSARMLKVNPDAPQRAVRLLALQRGVRVCVATPRLASGFLLLDPDHIPPDRLGEAATRATMQRWAEPVALADLPVFDAIVAGSVAVTATGKRCGKGAGYSDLEFAILRELGHPPVPVATTVHDLQVVEDFPVEPIDQPLALVCTPTRSVRIEIAGQPPAGIEWSRLSAAALAAMPVLQELRTLQTRSTTAR
jgi:5-formyltetrahydrofolate cyclo-ligase